MSWQVEHPWWLAGLLLCLLPLLGHGRPPSPYAGLAVLPADAVSVWLMVLLRAAAAAAIAALVLGLAGLSQGGQTVERIAHGTNIVLLLDRSNSMDHTFAGKAPSGGQESKAAAARRLLHDFVRQRPHDRVGLVEFSTAPMFVLPLTQNKDALRAAINATATPALAYTHVSKGLAMAADMLGRPGPEATGARTVLLVSDGAAAIDKDSELALRTAFKRGQIRLYWLFLRSQGSHGLFTPPEDPRDDNPDVMPERHLHLFFSSLGIAYQAWQAENPQAMEAAMAEVNRLEQTPLHYLERLPKQDWSVACYRLALALLAVLWLAKWLEVRV